MRDLDTVELILWRHAEAADGFPDHARPLTDRGREQALRMARWLDLRLPEDTEILVSPAKRTQQTAELLGRPFKTCPDVGTQADAARVLASADWPTKRSVLVVGHQPTIGQVAALLLSGREDYWPVQTAAVWWLSGRMHVTQAMLRAMVTPDML